MKGRTVALDTLKGREAAALIVDGRLADLIVGHDGPRPGDIHRAIVDRPIKGAGGVMVRLADGPGWLRGVRGPKEGQAITVQVTGHAEPGKAPPVTDRILVKSRYTIATPGARGINVSRAIRDEEEADRLRLIAHEAGAEALILRSAAQGVPGDAVGQDVAAVIAAAEAVAAHEGDAPELLLRGDGPHALAWRDWAEPADLDGAPGSFERHGVLEEIDALLRPQVALGPHAMFVEPTRALVAVDVNTGGDGSLAAGLKANLAALRELPRQLLLRGLGGQVAIDLAPLPKKDRRQIEQAAKAAFRAGPVETMVAGWTPLGHLELRRKRERVPLAECLGGAT